MTFFWNLFLKNHLNYSCCILPVYEAPIPSREKGSMPASKWWKYISKYYKAWPCPCKNLSPPDKTHFQCHPHCFCPYWYLFSEENSPIHLYPSIYPSIHPPIYPHLQSFPRIRIKLSPRCVFTSEPYFWTGELLVWLSRNIFGKAA